MNSTLNKALVFHYMKNCIDIVNDFKGQTHETEVENSAYYLEEKSGEFSREKIYNLTAGKEELILVTDKELVEGDIPYGITYLVYWNNKHPFKPGVIPSSVRYLTFINGYDLPLIPGAIPNSVKSITFNEDFCQELVMGIIPWGVEFIDFNCVNLAKLDLGVIPSSVKNIKLNYKYEFEPGVIPSSVQTLVLNDFNQKLKPGDIPNGVIELFLPYNFDQKIEANVLPPSIKIIHFANAEYSHELEIGSIPYGVEEIYFEQIKRIGKNVLPNTIKKLVFDYGITFKLEDGILPTSLEYLSIMSSPFCYIDNKNFDDVLNYIQNCDTEAKLINLKTFKINGEIRKNLDNLPDGLEELEIESVTFNLPLNNLPFSLKKLKIQCLNYSHTLDNLPDGLEELIIFSNYNLPLDNLPNNLKFAKLGLNSYDHELNNLPNMLTCLELRGKFNCKLENLPFGLKKLSLIKFNGSLGQLPEGIERLSILDRSFILINKFPKSLTHLKLDYNIRMLDKELISNLKYIDLRGCDLKKKHKDIFPKDLIQLILDLSGFEEDIDCYNIVYANEYAHNMDKDKFKSVSPVIDKMNLFIESVSNNLIGKKIYNELIQKAPIFDP